MPHKIKSFVLFSVLIGLCVFQAGCFDAKYGQLQEKAEVFSHKSVAIASKVLEVRVDPTFPQVFGYIYKPTLDVMYAAHSSKKIICINGVDETVSDVKFSSGSNKATYQLKCPSCWLDVQMKVVDDVLEFLIVNVREQNEAVVNTIEIPSHGILALRSDQANAVLATALIDADKSKCGDTFTVIDENTEVSNETRSSAYAMVSTDTLAAAIETNSVYDYPNKKSENPRYAKGANKTCNGRIKYEITKSDEVVIASLSSGQWTWQADESDKTEPAPYIKVIITPDRNDDEKVDWQDAAIAFRKIMHNPRGWENTADRVAQHISFNFASFAGNPFLRALDNVKRVYYVTDGLEQLVLLKGYQSEGHDSAHADYGGNIGIRQGGKRDLNILVNEGSKFNADFGVHLNCTEAYPEAKCFSDDFVDASKPGWGWLDQSYYIRHRKDLTSGFFKERIAQLKKDVPGLEFVYMDVYFGDGWEGLEMARTINQAGMDMATEFPRQIEHSAIWSHWSVDMTYGPNTSRGINSQIIRFVRNHQKDMFLQHPLLGHAEIGDFEGWQGRTNFNQFLDKVYGASLPAKYLQHFLIENWQEHEIRFTDNVIVNDFDGRRKIYKDGRLILDGSCYLLPWEPKSEKKLYHWNPEGGKTDWQLPNSWNVDTIKLYKLTDTGREFVDGLKVIDGIITIDAEKKQPYVVYSSTPKKEPNANWGQGGYVKDPGFNDKRLPDWNVEGAEDGVGVVIDGHGRSALALTCNKPVSVSQTVRGLKKGVYSASVWAEVKDGTRKASLTVVPDGGVEQTVWCDHSFAFNFAGNCSWNRTTMQRMRVIFEVPAWKNSAIIKLAAEAGDALVRFDDVRLVPAVKAEKDGYLIFEDFENVDEGWYPFVKGEAGGVTDPTTHLSELHAPYTNAGWNDKLVDDTIDGNWSLKSHNERGGIVYHTIPQTVRFVPGKQYEVSFDYQCAHAGEYAFVIGSNGGDDRQIISESPFEEKRETARYTATITVGDDSYVWFGIKRTPVQTEQKRKEIDFVMDNLAVREIE